MATTLTERTPPQPPISINSAQAGPLAAGALTLARRFQHLEDIILRFVPTLPCL
jgi:hypothetical protein